jgi:predicted transposase YdaD
MAEDFIQEIERVLPSIEDRMHIEEKKEELCQSSLEINKGLSGKNRWLSISSLFLAPPPPLRFLASSFPAACPFVSSV